MTILEAKSIKKIYGGKKGNNQTVALNGVDMKIQRGEFIGVMGPSGSGKTTLLNILGGLDKSTSGVVEINKKNISEMNKEELAIFRRKNIGFVFQDFNLLDSLSLKENVMLPMILNKHNEDLIEERAKDIMVAFDIYDLKDKYPYEVSGGEQQRTSASRALITNPSIVFADEPTGNLDSKSSNKIMNYLDKINTERKSTILMVTHDPFAASFCRKIVFIKDGLVKMEIVKNENRKEFFEKILDCLAVIGGEYN